MNSVFEYIIAGALVTVVLFLTYGFANRMSRGRVVRDFRRPDEILTAVDIYVKYDRKRAARELLETGLERYPNDESLRARAAELDADAS